VQSARGRPTFARLASTPPTLAVPWTHPTVQPMGTPRTNIEIIFVDWLDAIRRGDLAQIAARLAPDVTHQGVRADLLCSSRDAVLDNVRARARRAPEVEALEIIGSGDHVVLAIRSPGLGVADHEDDPVPRGKAFVVFTLRHGMIIRMQDYRTRAEALAAAGAAHLGNWD